MPNEVQESHEKLTPNELFKKHMADPNHVITESEMKNLIVKPEADKSLEEKEKSKLDEITKQIGNHPPNPYDVLGE